MQKIQGALTYLPYSYYSISDEDEEDDEGFHKGCDRPFPFFKPCQRLQDSKKLKISSSVEDEILLTCEYL